jgi:hypothetical protein
MGRSGPSAEMYAPVGSSSTLTGRRPFRFAVLGSDAPLLAGLPLRNARFEAIISALEAACASATAGVSAFQADQNGNQGDDSSTVFSSGPKCASDGWRGAQESVSAASVRQLPRAQSSPFPRLVGEGALKNSNLRLLADIQADPPSTAAGPPRAQGLLGGVLPPSSCCPWGVLCSALHPAPRPQPMPRPVATASAGGSLEVKSECRWHLYCWSAGPWHLMMHVYPGPRSKRCYAR